MYPQQWPPPPPKIAPIVHPDVPRWMHVMTLTHPDEWSKDSAKLLMPVLVPIGFLGAMAIDGVSGVAALGALISTIFLLVAGLVAAFAMRPLNHVVHFGVVPPRRWTTPKWTFRWAGRAGRGGRR